MTSRVGRGVASAARRVALLSAAATATTPRPTPARPDNIVADYFYSHVAKTGGGSFAKMVEKGRLRPLRPCHVPLHTLRCARQRCDVALNGRGAPCVASSEGHLKNVALDPRVKLWISAREPFAHVVSLYAHCQQPGAAGKRRHAFPNATLSEFIDVFYSRGGVAPAKRRGGVEMVALGHGLLGSSRRFENHRRQSSVSSNSVARAGTAPTTRGTSRRGIWVTATSRGRRASSTKRTGS